jgi:hypothetical protein
MRKKNIILAYPDLLQEWHHKNNIAIEDTGVKTKVWWKCPVANDHEWLAEIYERVNGKGCPFCANRKVGISNCLKTTHPEIAKQWHPTKNGNLLPSMITAGSNKKVWWKCQVAEDHEWQTSVSHRLNGRNCPCCSGHKVVKSTSIATTHSHLSNEWHQSLNGNLGPENVSAGSGLKVWWKCIHGHVWRAIVGDRSNGNNCPLCNISKGESRIEKFLQSQNITFEREFSFTTCKNKRVLYFDFMVQCGKMRLIEYQGEQHYRPVQFGSKVNIISVWNRTKNNDAIKRNWCAINNIPLLEVPYWDFENIETIIVDFLNE